MDKFLVFVVVVVDDDDDEPNHAELPQFQIMQSCISSSAMHFAFLIFFIEKYFDYVKTYTSKSKDKKHYSITKFCETNLIINFLINDKYMIITSV